MADESASGNAIVRAAFAPLIDLPSWQVTGEFGSYLTFHFGSPRVTVNEPCEALRYRRLAGVEGQYQLWMEMCHWVAYQDGKKMAHNESTRDDIRRAAAMLQGQKLLGFYLKLDPAGGEFVFDLGGKLTYQRYDPLDSGHALWNFSTHKNENELEIVSFTAAGRVSVFAICENRKNQGNHRCDVGWIHVQPSAQTNDFPQL